MIQTWLTSLSNAAQLIGDALLAPGYFLFSAATAVRPDLLNTVGIRAGDESVTAGIAIVYWLVVLFVTLRAVRLLRNMGRSLVAIVHALAYRCSQHLAGLRVRLRLRLRGLARWRRLLKHAEPPLVEFDDLELAVLHYGVARGAGFSISAPELAEKLSVRPSQVQRCLDKLRQNRMLDIAIGSTDGYDNYRLTDSGAAFFAMWQRQSGTV